MSRECNGRGHGQGRNVFHGMECHVIQYRLCIYPCMYWYVCISMYVCSMYVMVCMYVGR